MGGAVSNSGVKLNPLNLFNRDVQAQPLEANERIKSSAQDVSVRGLDGQDLSQKFLSSHNLKQVDSWTHLFQRVHVSEAQIKEAAPYAEHFNFDDKVRVGDKQQFSLAKLDYDKRSHYGYFTGTFKGVAPKDQASLRAYDGFKEYLGKEHGPDPRGLFNRLWSSAKDWVLGENKIEFTRDIARPPAEPGAEQPAAAADAPAGRGSDQLLQAAAARPVAQEGDAQGRLLEEGQAKAEPEPQSPAYLLGVRTKNSQPVGELVKWDTDYQQGRINKVGNFLGRAGPWLAAGAAVGALLFLGGGPVAVFGVLAGAIGNLGATGAIVGAAVGLPLLGKLTSYLKNPLWGNTVLGKIQHHERKEAGRVADEFAKMVKDQVLFDQSDAGLAGGAQPAYKNPELLKDGKAISDFVKVAKHKSAKELRSMVREHLLSDASHLDKRTRSYANSGAGAAIFKNWWFTGNQKAHATKTVEMVTNAIADGIMRGIGEGSLELIERGLSDEATRKAKTEIEKIVVPAINDFQQMATHLAPGVLGVAQMADAEEAIHKVAEEALNPNNPFDRFIAKATGTSQQLRAAEATVGAQNEANFDQALKDHSAEAVKQKASLIHIRSLVEGHQGPPPQPVQPGLRDANIGMVDLLAEVNTAQDVEDKKAALKAALDAVVKRLDTPDMAKAVTGDHAQRFLKLVKTMQDAIDHAATYAKTIAEAQEALAAPGLTSAQIKQWGEKLEQLNNQAAPNLDPLDTGDGNVSQAVNGAAQRANDLAALCKQVAVAAEQTDLINSTMTDTEGQIKLALSDAAGGRDLRGALEGLLEGASYQSVLAQSNVQDVALQAWAASGRTAPSDIRSADQTKDAWRSRMAAAAMDTSLQACSPEGRATLELLGTKASARVLLDLRSLVQAKPHDAQELLTKLGAAGLREAGTAESAVKALALARTAYQGIEGLNPGKALALAQALHPDHDAVLTSLHAYAGATEALQGLMKEGVCGKLLAWQEAQSILKGLQGGGVQAVAQQAPLQQNLSALLGALDEFLQVHDDVAAPGDRQAVQDLKKNLDTFGNRLGLPGNLGAADPAAIEALKVDDLDRVARLAMNLAQNKPIDEKTRALQRQAEDLRLQLQAQQEVVERQILQEAGPGVENVQQAIIQAAQPKQGVDPAQFAAMVDELQQALDLALKNERGLNAGQEITQQQLTFLKTTLNFKGSTAELQERIEGHRELARDVSLLMAASQRLEGQQAPALLGHRYAPEDLLQGAKTIAQLKPTNLNQLGDVSPESRQRLADRNLLILKFKDKDDGQINRLLGNPQKAGYGSSGLSRLVADFLYEERALAELKRIADPENKTSLQAFRETVEYTNPRIVDQSLDRTAALSPVNLDEVQNNLRRALAPRLDALKSLVQDGGLGATGSHYLMGQLEALTDMVGEPEVLRANYDQQASRGGLLAVGRRFAEADRLKGKTAGQIKLAYLQGQYDSSRAQLKYFNPRTFEARRPGFFGRIIFKLMDKGQRVDRLLQKPEVEKVRQTIAQLALTPAERQALTEQYELAQKALSTAQAKRDQLVLNKGIVQSSLLLKAIEHMQHKAVGDPGARLGEADIDAILGVWREMVGPNATAAFPDLVRDFKAKFDGCNAQDLEAKLNPQQREAVQIQFSAVLAEREKALAAHEAVLNRLQLAAPEAAQANVDQLFEVFRERNSSAALKTAREYGTEALKTLDETFAQARQAVGKDAGKGLVAWLPKLDLSAVLNNANLATQYFGRASMYAGVGADMNEGFDSPEQAGAEAAEIEKAEQEFRDRFMAKLRQSLGNVALDLQNSVPRLAELSDFTATQDIRDTFQRSSEAFKSAQDKVDRYRKTDATKAGLARLDRYNALMSTLQGVRQLERLVQPHYLVPDLKDKVGAAVVADLKGNDRTALLKRLQEPLEKVPVEDQESPFVDGDLGMTSLYRDAVNARVQVGRAILLMDEKDFPESQLVYLATTQTMLGAMMANPFLGSDERKQMGTDLVAIKNTLAALRKEEFKL